MAAMRYDSCCRRIMLALSYVLPLRSDGPVGDELVSYVRALSQRCDLIVVDGSPGQVFDDVARRCGDDVRHVPPDADTAGYVNGKVSGVVTGVRLARHEHVVIADDDVRHTPATLQALVLALRHADIVRPQNFFAPLSWHARLDTARTLINRATGGDWPGTLAVRRSTFMRAGGYAGEVMFENLELVRTIVAVGGRACRADDIYVCRRPPSTAHFLSQRVRQAYDEFARPLRMTVWLGIVPGASVLLWVYGPQAAALLVAAPALVAEIGRQRKGARRVFPLSASLLAPLWVLERSVCAWLAVALRVTLGGVPYRGRIVRTASNSIRVLRRRLAVATPHLER